VRLVQWVGLSMEESMVKRLEEEVCFKSRVKKRRSDWWWQRWWWQRGSDVFRVVRRWKTRMWMRLTKRIKNEKVYSDGGVLHVEKTACCFEWWGSRWSGDVSCRLTVTYSDMSYISHNFRECPDIEINT